MSDPHVSAVIAMLQQQLGPSTAIHDTDASSAAGTASSYPYVVISGGVAPRQYDAIGACTTGADGLLRVTSVALTAGAVRELVVLTRDALEGHQLRVPGGQDIGLWDSQGVEVDRDVKVVLGTSTLFPFYAVDIYRVRSST